MPPSDRSGRSSRHRRIESNSSAYKSKLSIVKLRSKPSITEITARLCSIPISTDNKVIRLSNLTLGGVVGLSFINNNKIIMTCWIGPWLKALHDWSTEPISLSLCLYIRHWKLQYVSTVSFTKTFRTNWGQSKVISPCTHALSLIATTNAVNTLLQ